MAFSGSASAESSSTSAVPTRKVKTTPRPKPTPLHVVGEYALHPLHVCSEDGIAELFCKICQRGNPILQGVPAEDLKFLGAAFYKKSVRCPVSVVFLKGDEPVALFFGWDVASGGVWQGTDGPPASLIHHAEIGKAAFESIPLSPSTGEVVFMAFGGVALPHPGALLMSMGVFGNLAAAGAGYRKSFGYAVHPKTIETAQSRGQERGCRDMWRLTYTDIVVADETVRMKIASVNPGYAECSLTDLGWSLRQFDALQDEQMKAFMESLRAGAKMAARRREGPGMSEGDVRLMSCL